MKSSSSQVRTATPWVTKEPAKRTEKCVRCGKPTKFTCGHVVIDRGEGENRQLVCVIAGWCSDYCFNETKHGFAGHWQPWMGAK